MSLIELKASANMKHERATAQDVDIVQLLAMSPTQINNRVDALLATPTGTARMFKILFRLLIVVARKNMR